MLAHKLDFEEFDDHSYKLFAIHGSVEGYKLAFLLNLYLGIHLFRMRTDMDIQIDANSVYFAWYNFQDVNQYCQYYLICNHSHHNTVQTAAAGSLFGADEWTSRSALLLSEFPKADFFLKIEDETGFLNEQDLLKKINNIPQIATAYLIAPDRIKSKENLIFD